MSLNRSEHDGMAILEFDLPDSKVNILTSEVLHQFDEEIEKLSKEKHEALIITSNKKGIFIAGANIEEIENITDPKDAYDKAELGKKILDKLEDLPYPSIAVINGACLGGGLELALACSHRVASFDAAVKIGLPEVKLGILPGFGGSIRLPKLIGLQKSLGMILPGKIVDSKTASKYGIVDKLFSGATLKEDALAFAKQLNGKKTRPPKKKDSFLNNFLENTPMGRNIVFKKALDNVLKSTKGHYPAPVQALKTVRDCFGKPRAKANHLESEGFGKLAITPISKNLIKVFYLDETYRKRSWTNKEAKTTPIQKCGVIGAGIMGGGIAQLLSYRNIPSRLKDINYDALALALRTAQKVYKGLIKKRKMKKPEVEKQLALISPTTTYEGFKSCDIVIEAVIENLDIKQQVFKELDENTGSDTILVSNTSSLPIINMANATNRKDKVAGLHFFNPVHRMPLVEIITTDHTSPETVETVLKFSRKLGKMVILVKDVPGFLVNRVLLPYMNEAAYLLEDGVSINKIDSIAKQFGMPMGPMELADEVGIDVGYKVAKILEDSYGERMKVCSILDKIYETKQFGKKTGKGFYDHSSKPRSLNNDISTILPKPNDQMPNEVVIKRLIYIMINEASRCLEEHVIDKPDTVDVGMIYGTGFPPFRGGLMRYADSAGVSNIVKDLEAFQKEFNEERFRPSALLKEMAIENKSFYTK